jgi:GxxExxY protein
MSENDITKKIVSAAIEVHKTLGPGLFESVYEKCLIHELQSMGLHVISQKPLPVVYKENIMDCGFRPDLLVEEKVIVELKSVDEMNSVHMAQMITYLKLSNNKLGLLINFNVVLLKNGIKRVINGVLEEAKNLPSFRFAKGRTLCSKP